MPRKKYYQNAKAEAWMTPDQRLASEERLRELRSNRKEKRRVRRLAVLRAKRTPHPRVKQTHCNRGHERIAENIGHHYTCLLCEKLRLSLVNRRKHPENTKACAWCSQEFTTTKTVQVYCGQPCKLAAHKKKQRIARRDRIRKKTWYANLTHEEHFLINVLWSRELRKANEKRKSKTPGGRARSRAVNHRRRARKRGNGGSWTGKQWVALKAEHGKCLGCNRTEAEVIAMGWKLVPDHIKPLALGGANSIENLQPLCHGGGSSCNVAKGARWVDYRPGFTLEIA